MNVNSLCSNLFNLGKIKLMLKKLDYKKNHHTLFIEGNFQDSKDSFYFICLEHVWHITFVKVGDKIEEWIREIIIVDGVEDFFLAEVDVRYTSNYKTMGGARGFIAKQPLFSQYKEIINEFVKSKFKYSKFNLNRDLGTGPRDVYGLDDFTPF